MPELPEIALFKKYVDATALHKKIIEVKFPDKSLLQDSASKFTAALKGKEFQETERRGKYLFLKLKDKSWLVLHFGMTGKLEYYKDGEEPKYTKLLLKFDNSFHLAFTCRRKLGKIFLTEGVEEFRDRQDLGKDALELDKKEFFNLLENKRGSIKGFLTDQNTIAGIGNIYSDEILYQVEIHPKTSVSQLSDKEKGKIYSAMGRVLKTIIRNDGDRSTLPSGYLVSHRKEGEDCPKCSGKIKKISVSGRSTYFCPDCQKEKK